MTIRFNAEREQIRRLEVGRAATLEVSRRRARPGRSPAPRPGGPRGPRHTGALRDLRLGGRALSDHLHPGDRRRVPPSGHTRRDPGGAVSRLLPALAARALVAGCSSGSEPARRPAPGAGARGHRGPAPDVASAGALPSRAVELPRGDRAHPLRRARRPRRRRRRPLCPRSARRLTAPGLTVVDVKRSLRPRPCPARATA